MCFDYDTIEETVINLLLKLILISLTRLTSLMSTCTHVLFPCVLTHDFLFPSLTRLAFSSPFVCSKMELLNAMLSVIELFYFKIFFHLSKKKNKGDIDGKHDVLMRVLIIAYKYKYAYLKKTEEVEIMIILICKFALA